jgi:hypothetical protein
LPIALNTSVIRLETTLLSKSISIIASLRVCLRFQLDTITFLTNLASTLFLSGIASDVTTRVMYKVPRREAL